ncbi:hypothetical protein [Streptomyces canus]|uniref:hypothetical protein n=1 Tax=Streptomyces canus TaxID=58343 RepID=UPI00039B5620|nr:hypothetical protein [Streptomyces canus]
METKLKNAVCAGIITLSAARSAIKTNWTTALQVTGVTRRMSRHTVPPPLRTRRLAGYTAADVQLVASPVRPACW